MEKNIWTLSLDSLKNSVNNQIFDTWFKPTSFISLENDVLKVSVPNIFFKNWLEKRYYNLILELLENLTNKKIDIKFIVQSIELPTQVIDSNTSTNIKKNFYKLNPQYTFDNFIVGPSNRFAHAASLAVAESPASSYNPLFIYGGVGLGKTHLMQAIGNFLINTKQNIKIVYLSTEEFMNEMINSIQEKKTVDFRKKYRNIDVLLVDDIQFLANKDITQLEFFHTFNALHDAHRQIVITCDSPPKDIPTLEERLISRFEWGLITDIQPPDLETRICILKKKLEIKNFLLQDEIIYFIADKFKSNIRELEGALNKVLAFAKLNNVNITIDLTKEILKDLILIEKKEINIDLVQKIVSNFFKIDIKYMKSKERSKEITYPRQIAMYLCRELTNFSLPEIGREFGNRDHTTVLHSYNLINKKIKSDKNVTKIINELKYEIIK